MSSSLSPSLKQSTSTSRSEETSKSSSDHTLQRLDDLDNYFASFASRVERIDKSINMGDRRTLVSAKRELAEIIGDLESLQFNEVLVENIICETSSFLKVFLRLIVTVHQIRRLLIAGL